MVAPRDERLLRPPPALVTAPGSVRTLLANRDFRRLWLADIVSDAGSFITFIALAVYVHELTGQAFAVGVALGLRAIPWLTVGPVAGVIADRVDRRLMMVICDLARAGLVAMLPFTDTAAQAYAISFASGVFGPVFRPARQALIPRVVPAEQYVRALALGEVSHQVLHTVGPALGGAAVLAVGARNAFFLDAATFLVSAALVVGIGVRGPVRGRPAGFDDVWRDLVEGARILWRDRILRAVVSAEAAVLLGFEGVVALLVVYVREDLARDAGSFGIVLAASGLGTVLGTVALARRGHAAGRALPLAAAASGPALFLLVGLRPGLGALIAIMAAVGVTGAGMALYVNTSIAERTPDEARGRAFGLSGAALQLGDLIGALGLAALGDRIGSARGITIGGALAAALAIAALAPAGRALRAADAERARAAPSAGKA